MNVLVLEPLEQEVMQWLEQRHEVRFAPELVRDPIALHASLSGVHALILPAHVAVDARLLRAAPRLRVIGRVSAGAENMDLDACRAAQVDVIRAAGATADAEAEFCVAALLNLLRRVPVQCSDGLWAGRELGCSTVGLLGITPASRVLAQLLAAFGSRVMGYDPTLHQSDPLWEQWGIEPLSLKELMEQSDAVCVKLPFYPRYKGLLGDRVLSNAKPRQVLVSLSHSALFDDVALAGAMSAGRILAVWMDSVEPGWQDPGKPMHHMAGLQVSPRLASTTRESRRRAAWLVAKRVDELLSAASPHDAKAPDITGG